MFRLDFAVKLRSIFKKCEMRSKLSNYGNLECSL